MASITELVESEINRFPDNVGHVLGSRSLRRYDSLSGRLTYLAWKGRDTPLTASRYAKAMVGAAGKIPRRLNKRRLKMCRRPLLRLCSNGPRRSFDPATPKVCPKTTERFSPFARFS